MNERIEGVPVGTKLAKVALAEDISSGSDRMFKASIRLVSDNVYGVIDLSTVPIQYNIAEFGFEINGASVAEAFYDVNPEGEGHFISDAGEIMLCREKSRNSDRDKRRIHVRPIKPKTRRVLVADIGSGSLLTEEHAKLLVEWHPNFYRIEERPL